MLEAFIVVFSEVYGYALERYGVGFLYLIRKVDNGIFGTFDRYILVSSEGSSYVPSVSVTVVGSVALEITSSSSSTVLAPLPSTTVYKVVFSSFTSLITEYPSATKFVPAPSAALSAG